MRGHGAPATSGDTVDDVLEYYYRYLARNRDLSVQFERFKKRLSNNSKTATAEAIVFSLLRAGTLRPELFEDVSTGGPDFRCARSPNGTFLVEVTCLDSEMVTRRSGLPSTITRAGSGAFGLITDRLLSEAKKQGTPTRALPVAWCPTLPHHAAASG
jgi:hypothetical protein